MPSSDEERLLADLAAAGCETSSIWTWVFSKPQEYLAAGPVLVKHLGRSQDQHLIKGIARLLSHQEFGFAVPALISELEQPQSRSTKYALASALLAVGVAGHEEGVLRLLERKQPIAVNTVLKKALRRAGGDLTDVNRRAMLREKAWSTRLLAVLLVLAGMGALLACLLSRGVPLYQTGLSSLYGLTSLALGVSLWRRGPWALPFYVVWVLLGLATMATIQITSMPFPWMTFGALLLGAILLFVIVGRYLFDT